MKQLLLIAVTASLLACSDRTLYRVDDLGLPILSVCWIPHTSMLGKDFRRYPGTDCVYPARADGKVFELSCPGVVPPGFFQAARKDGVAFVRVGSFVTDPILDLNKDQIVFCAQLSFERWVRTIR